MVVRHLRVRNSWTRSRQRVHQVMTLLRQLAGQHAGRKSTRRPAPAWGSSPTYSDTGDLNEARTHNAANELAQINPPTPAQPLLYDHAGNMTE